ncbi:FAD-dependent oxidoreductase [Micromonospora zamorensis]|uniref:FAD-dependent oxidoreductase n=1 Tax=Micromonospora zamorensis TaxID=709883 RepID=UPI002E17B84D
MFQDGHRTSCGILIGADGARSVVRSLLTDGELSYVATIVELSVEDADRRHSDLAELVGPGNLRCVGVNQSWQRNASATAASESGSRCTEDQPLDTYRSKRALFDMFAGWIPLPHRPHRGRRRRADAAPDRGDAHRYVLANRPGVTLIGDAAHLMPPVGEGANQAMLDAAEFAGQLADVCTNKFSP